MIRIVVAALLAGSTAACADRPSWRAASCEFAVPQGVSVECGWLKVPEKRSNPQSRLIEIHVARYRSRASKPAPDPILWLVGGPGGKAHTFTTAAFDKLVRPYLDTRDFIAFDPRGVGYSRPSPRCEYNDRGCIDRLRRDGFQVEAYNSAELAADVEDLRKALRINEWNLLGESYGTHLALVAMRLFPEGVRSVVLDSVLPPGYDNRAIGDKSFAAALKLLFTNCAADPACGGKYPRLEQSFEAARKRVSERPVRIAGLSHETQYDMRLDGQSIYRQMFVAFMESDAIGLMPSAIQGLAEGETREGWHRTAATYAVIDQHLVNNTVNVIWSCNDSALLPGFRQQCEQVGLTQQLKMPVSPSNKPTLLLAGEYDPSTPPEGARVAASALPNGQLLMFRGHGHMVTMGECAPEVIKQFLAAPMRRLERTCAEKLTTVWR